MSTRFTAAQLQNLCSAAIDAGQEAARCIESVDRHELKRCFKDAGSTAASQLVKVVDMRSEDIVRQRLLTISESLDIAFVGEESCLTASVDARARFEKDYFWCVDPLDGTLPFVEGRPGYAVSIALVEQSGQPVIGVVVDPTHQTVYHAIAGHGCYRDKLPLTQLKTEEASNSLLVYSDASFKTHADYELAVSALEQCARHLGLDGVVFNYGNGAVKNACKVLEARHACYVKLPKKEEGGGSTWDFAATACLAIESGGWASNVHGQPLALNRRGSTFMNHDGVVFASNKEIAHFLINAL